MAYTNWRNPLDEDEEDPTYWYEGFGQAGKSAVNNFGKSMGVMWESVNNGALKRGLAEQLEPWKQPAPINSYGLMGSVVRKQPQQPVQKNWNPAGLGQDALKLKALADRKFKEGQTAYYQAIPAPINSYGLMGSVVPKKPIYTYGLMGSAIRPDLSSVDSVRRWLQAESLKYGSQGTTFPGMTIPQDRSVKVDTGFTAPPTTPYDYGGYGGYYSYGGGGGYSYKPQPKPWYMSLTNWRI